MIVLNGTREGLFLGAVAAKRYVGARAGTPAILIPNPFYAAYAAGAGAAECEPVYMPTTRETGFLPDLDAIDEALLKRTVAFYIASPSNPQGAVADRAYLMRLVEMARRFGFLIFADECYCEIYLNGRAPPACSKCRDRTSPTSWCFTRCRSDRTCRDCASALPPATAFSAATSSCATSRRPQVPVPAQEVAIACYGDEAHVEENRELYFDGRSRRSDHRRPLRLRATGRRIFSLARRQSAGRRRGRGASSGRRRPPRHSGPLSRARRRGRQ